MLGMRHSMPVNEKKRWKLNLGSMPLQTTVLTASLTPDSREGHYKLRARMLETPVAVTGSTRYKASFSLLT